MASASRRGHRIVCVALLLISAVFSAGCGKSKSGAGNGWRHSAGKTVELPKPVTDAGMPLATALKKRRSHREFAATPLTAEQLSQLCWAAQGVTDVTGGRTAPSAGALYPITLVMADKRGVFEYRPDTHSLIPHGDTDVRDKLQKAALNQSAIGNAPVCFIVTMDVSVTAKKYGSESERYCLLEAGHVTQNLLLTAASLDLAAVPIGALSESKFSKALGLPGRLRAVYVIPVGNPP